MKQVIPGGLYSITIVAALFAGAAGCSSSPATVDDIGIACDSDSQCSNGTECGTCGIGTGQCVLPCTMSGSADCPTGSFCSQAWEGTTTHICVRTCDADIDCQTPTGNAGLSCNGAYVEPGVNDDDIQICNVSNSIGSVHTCE